MVLLAIQSSIENHFKTLMLNCPITQFLNSAKRSPVVLLSNWNPIDPVNCFEILRLEAQEILLAANSLFVIWDQALALDSTISYAIQRTSQTKDLLL